ncbi:MAG: TatD family hydrolase [bacterium]|nr:TatD family hydrolase [bacterium]
MHYIDAHCHLNHPRLLNRTEEILELCERENVKTLVVVGYDEKTNKAALELLEKYKENKYGIKLFISFGFHPKLISEEKWRIKFSRFLEFLDEHKQEFSFIGEVGLDYYWVKAVIYRQAQLSALKELLELANEKRKPVIIHCRNAWKEFIAFAKEQEVKVPLILHAFSGSKGDVRNLKALSTRIYFSFATNVVRNRSYAQVMKVVPLHRLLLETDSPYLSPDSEENLPHKVVQAYKFAAETFSLDIGKLKTLVYSNFYQLVNES